MTSVRLIRPARRLACIVVALLGMFVAHAAAQVSSCALLPMRTDLRPNAGGPPVEVGVGLLIADIRAVDDASASLVGEFVISLDWIDPRLTGLAGCRFPVDAVWSPDIGTFNASDLIDAQRGARDRVEVGEGGYVSYRRRLSGTIATGHRLHRFPFDRPEFTFLIGAPDDGPDQIALHSAEDRSARAERLSLEGWRFGALRVETRIEPVEGYGARSVLRATLPAERAPLVHVVRTLGPMLVLVVLSWAIFWIPPERYEVEVGLCAAMLLVLFALRAATAVEAPRPGYLTLLDKLEAWATLAILLALLKSVATGVLLVRGADGAVERIDRIARFVIPASFVAGWVAILAF